MKIVAIVEAAIAEIRNRWHKHDACRVIHADNILKTYTEADIAVQQLIVEMLNNEFPGYGIIAEEDLQIKCSMLAIDAYFTVDPIDGTTAFRRQQAFGVGTQIALVINGEVTCAVIGDANSGNLYWYGPADETIWLKSHGMIIDLLVDERVRRRRAKPLNEQVVTLWKSPEYITSPLWRQLIKPAEFGGAFLDYHIIPGSIGLRVARLLTSEIGAHLLHLRANTPWDMAPIIGMTKRLNIAWLRLTEPLGMLTRFEPSLPPETITNDQTVLLIPREKVPELLEAASK